MDKLLMLEPGMIIWTFITFGCLLFILKKFAWKPLLASLEKREEGIRSTLQRTEHAREEAEALLAEHRKIMQSSELEARRIIDEARQSADKVRDEILAKAEEHARMMTTQAKADIQREKETALAQLRSEIADLAILAASRILKENLDETRNKALVESFIADLPKN